MTSVSKKSIRRGLFGALLLTVVSSALFGGSCSESSEEPGPSRAFTIEAREQLEGDASFDQLAKGLSGASSSLNATASRMSVDWSPMEASCGWVHASTLERSWLNAQISSDGEPRYRTGDGVLEWLSHTTRLGKLVGGGSPANSFDAIHIDADTGYVVDGRRISRRPRVIQVRRGPRIRVAALR